MITTLFGGGIMPAGYDLIEDPAVCQRLNA